MNKPKKIILTHGAYQNLESYQKCILIFDATFDFCTIFLKPGDRTIDQMIQAARSGKQNIVEGSVDSKISTETEIKLTGIARGSLDELLNDYQDYIRVHNLTLWAKDDIRTQEIRQFSRTGNRDYTTYKSYYKLGKDTPELFCNLMITLIHQANYLIDCQLRWLEKNFVNTGGIRERMAHARIEYKDKKQEELLALLREIYRELMNMQRQDLMKKVEKIAAIIKNNQK